jgi:hypothetical protein
MGTKLLRGLVLGVALGTAHCGSGDSSTSRAAGGDDRSTAGSGDSSTASTSTGGAQAAGGTGGKEQGSGGDTTTGGSASGGQAQTGATSSTDGGSAGSSLGGTLTSAGQGPAGAGNAATGGKPSGGDAPTGGNSTGGTPIGGATSSGGASSGGTAPSCAAGTPLTGGTEYCSSTQGDVGNGYAYSHWSNTAGACMTVYGIDAAFRADWSNVGDSLAGVGLEFSPSRSYDLLGTASSDYAFTRVDGSGEGYVGVHGWSLNPSVEYYIIEDWMGSSRPSFSTKKGTISVDAAEYDVYTDVLLGIEQPTTQFYSVRQTASRCGHISISRHFSEWAGLGMQLGDLVDIRVWVEGMDGSGSVDFTTATVVVTP